MKTEANNADLLMAAQALVSLDGRAALPRLLERLEQQSPDGLVLYTLRVARSFKDKTVMPALYPFLRHPNPSVRSEALSTLLSLDTELLLHALIRDSRNGDPTTHPFVAEALESLSRDPKIKASVRSLLTMK